MKCPKCNDSQPRRVCGSGDWAEQEKWCGCLPSDLCGCECPDCNDTGEIKDGKWWMCKDSTAWGEAEYPCRFKGGKMWYFDPENTKWRVAYGVRPLYRMKKVER